ncbi:MAG TPA: Hsp20/alpha crystallin family protein [Syntrophales bacterium]|nr:Hsp20/alpha crystallin family protein [Syntrophales bacterium]
MIKIRFSDDLGGLDSEFRRSFDEMFRLINSTFTVFQNVWRPHADIYESPKEIMILIDIAGVQKEDLYLEVDQRVLRIYGKREKQVTGNTRYHLAEITYGYFERKLHLPYPVDTDLVKATYTDGLLQIWMAKLPLDKVRRIPIQED